MEARAAGLGVEILPREADVERGAAAGARREPIGCVARLPGDALGLIGRRLGRAEPVGMDVGDLAGAGVHGADEAAVIEIEVIDGRAAGEAGRRPVDLLQEAPALIVLESDGCAARKRLGQAMTEGVVKVIARHAIGDDMRQALRLIVAVAVQGRAGLGDVGHAADRGLPEAVRRAAARRAGEAVAAAGIAVSGERRRGAAGQALALPVAGRIEGPVVNPVAALGMLQPAERVVLQIALIVAEEIRDRGYV